MNTEVEIRSFISRNQYNELLKFFKKEGKFVNEDYQETYYFDSKEDLRIQRNKFFSKIWLKKGKIHDDHREEIEIKFDREQFKDLERLFLSLGFGVEIKWFRKRYTFKWQGLEAMVDYTKGYGYILELEKVCPKEGKEKALKMLKQKLKTLNIPLTPREEFDKKYEYYRKNWRKLIRQPLTHKGGINLREYE